MYKDFTVMVSGTTTLSVAEIWPDGDAPENPSAADVAAVMRAVGEKEDVVVDWGMLNDCDVELFGGETSPLYELVWGAPRVLPHEMAAAKVCCCAS